MNDETGVQVVGARSKRTHQQMSREPSQGSSRSWRSHIHSQPEITITRPSRLPHIRTSRDGYDLRSPAQGPAQEEAVIDLTHEPETPPQRVPPRGSESRGSNSGRPPRFGRNILEDIVDLENDEEEHSHNPTEALSSSPEVQFVGSTTRHQPLPSRRLDSISMLPTFPPLIPRRRTDDTSIFPPLFSVHRLFGRNILPGSGPQEESMLIGSEFGPAGGFDELDHLNYAMPSFSMGSSSHQESPSRRDAYKPPSPAPEGFTRTLGDDDVAVCPNCYCELGTGEGKRQEIWVAKKCGHVYCGECSENRSKSKAKKAQGSQKTTPFSKCQVVGCGEAVSAPTSMVHLYL